MAEIGIGAFALSWGLGMALVRFPRAVSILIPTGLVIDLVALPLAIVLLAIALRSKPSRGTRYRALTLLIAAISILSFLLWAMVMPPR